MEIERVVEVHAPGVARGSGYLLAAGLILTARHVVGPPGSRCRWRCVLTDEGQARTTLAGFADAEVAWVGADADAALLRPCVGAHFVERLAPVVLGQLALGEELTVEIAGFPTYLLDAERSEIDKRRARVDAMRGSRSGRLMLDLLGAAPSERQDWRGISGGPVGAGELLVGHLEQVPAHLPASALQAVPVWRWIDEPGAAALLEQAGVDRQPRRVGAAEVAALPAAGRWAPLRERYRDAVVRTFCTLSRAGVLVGQAGVAVPAARAYMALRLAPQDAEATPDSHAQSVADVARMPRLVLVGAAGAGKSTVLKQALDLAARRDGRLPIWLPLAELPDDRRALTAERIIASLVEQAHTQLLLGEVNADFFRTALAEKPFAALAFDALDEAGGRARRDQVREAIAAFSAQWPLARVWLSSRPAAYAESPFRASSGQAPGEGELAAAPWRLWSVEPLDAGDVPAFLRQACADDGALARVLATRSDLAALAQSPLTLTMLAGMAVRDGLPADAACVFENWVQIMCTQWDEAKGEHASPEQQARRVDALRALGWAVQQRGEPAAPFSRHFARQALSGVCAGTLRDTLLAELLDRTGLIVTLARKEEAEMACVAEEVRTDRLSPDALRFAHLQIQEYLAGAHLAGLYADAPETALLALQGKWYRADWLEPLGFALAVLARDGDLHESLLQIVQALDEPYADLLPPRRTLLLARLLARVPRARPQRAAEVADELMRLIEQHRLMPQEAGEALIALAHHVAARPPIRLVAQGGGWVATASASEAHAWRLRATVALGQTEGDAAGLRLLDSVESTAPDLAGLLRCLRYRAQWGQADAAADRLAELFALHQLPGSIVAERESLGVRQAVDEVLCVIGRRERADTCIDALLTSRPPPDFATLVWAVQRGRLAADAALVQEQLAEIKRAVCASRADYYANERLGGSLRVALELAPQHTTPALTDLFAATLSHTGLIGWMAGPVGERFPALAREAVQRLVDYILDPELLEDSRRNGAIAVLIGCRDDSLAVPALLHLLGHLRSLRWQGRQIAESLRARGGSAQALSVLHALLRFDRGEITDLNERVVEAALRIDPPAVAQWVDARWPDALCRLVEAATRAPEVPDARDKAAPVTRQALEQRLAAMRDSDDDYARASLLGEMAAIGEPDAALRHADDWLLPLLPVRKRNARKLVVRLYALSRHGLWKPPWTGPFAAALRLLPPGQRGDWLGELELRA